MKAESNHQTKGLIRLTMACNERCVFCNVPMEDYTRLRIDDAIVDQGIDALVDDDAQTATISGGEPTLERARLLRIVRAIRARGIPYVEVQTNAVLIDKAYAEALANAGVTSGFVSLLSHRAAEHDALCGLSGAFEKCLAGIDAMIQAGIDVTLNPVTAYSTQSLVDDYIQFVAERLPQVRHISLSAVQPHGRAANNPELLPDYAVLKTVIPRALKRAEEHGLTVLNPYCGLPLCVGWTEAQDRSVEAIETSWDGAPGVDNRGNKSHGPPCRVCALRTRCGGAWHAYWTIRSGSGLQAPERLNYPWRGPWTDTPNQRCVEVVDVHVAAKQVAEHDVATRWVVSGDLSADDVSCIVDAGATHWVWRTQGTPDTSVSMLKIWRQLCTSHQQRPPQARCALSWWIRAVPSGKVAHRWLALAHALGIDRVIFEQSELEEMFWQAVQTRYAGLDVEQLHG